MKKYISILSVTLMCLGCSNEECAVLDDSNEVKFIVEHPYMQTRVTSTQFEAQDRIGVYMTEAGQPMDLIGNYMDNVPLTYDGNVWVPESKKYWNHESYNVYAYFPYDDNVSSIDDYPFSVSLDQSDEKSYERSDFLYASTKNVTASDKGVLLSFGHKMSRLMINLQKSDRYEGDIPENAEVYIHNTVPQATVDLTVGVPTKYARGEVKTIRARKISKGIYSAIIVPQRLSNKMPLVEVLCNGVSYLYEAKFNFQSGVQHNVNLTISKNPDQIKIELGGEIQNWE